MCYDSIVQKTLQGLIEEHFKQHLEFVVRNPILFGDFRTALDESEPRLYEDVQDYEATKAVFQEVCTCRCIFIKGTDIGSSLRDCFYLMAHYTYSFLKNCSTGRVPLTCLFGELLICFHNMYTC